jgi:excisionase family DNA binding protein
MSMRRTKAMEITEFEQPQADIEPLIKIEPLEKATGISRFQWYALAREKRIPVYTCGRALRFRLSEILKWMKEQTR